MRAPNRLGLAYIHVTEGDTGGARDNIPFNYSAFQHRFDGVWMVINGYNRKMAMDAGSKSHVSSFRRYLNLAMWWRPPRISDAG